jgi:hypothetical protein
MLQIDEAAGNARHIEPKIPRCEPPVLGWSEKFACEWSEVTA